jgi:hypothetical protein
MNRKSFLRTMLVVPVAGLAGRLLAAATHVQVYKTATCGCCGQWVAHMKANGFDVEFENVPDTAPYRKKYGVPDALASCHTAVVEGYAIEGHVPAADVQRLLKEKPKAAGLAVPGMVMGSPGMEGSTAQAYSVILFTADGKTSVWSKYPGKG